MLISRRVTFLVRRPVEISQSRIPSKAGELRAESLSVFYFQPRGIYIRFRMGWRFGNVAMAPFEVKAVEAEDLSLDFPFFRKLVYFSGPASTGHKFIRGN